MQPRTLLTAMFAVVLLTTSTACMVSPADTGPANATTSSASASAAPSATTLALPSGATPASRDFAGHWQSGTYGDAYLQVDGSTVQMVYTHDDGRFMGTVTGASLTGWWTEAPTRTPDADAGDAEFTLSREGSGTLAIHGKWRRGTAGDFQADWDMVKVDDVVPADVQTVFADRTQFVRHP